MPDDNQNSGENLIKTVKEETASKVSEGKQVFSDITSSKSKLRPGFVPIVIIVVGIILLAVIGLYFYGNSGRKSLTVSDSKQFPSVTPSITPSTVNAPTKVITIPKNATLFEKEVITPEHYDDPAHLITADNYNAPVGLVSYIDKRTSPPAYMKINSLLGTQTQSSKAGITYVQEFLNGANIAAFNDVRSWEDVFWYYNEGSSSLFIKDIPGIKYPQANKVRATMIYIVYPPGFGNITVVVYAEKGNDLIQLSKLLNDEALYRADKDACKNNYSTQEEIKASKDCYQNKLLQDANLQNVATTEANNLVSIFAIQ